MRGKKEGAGRWKKQITSKQVDRSDRTEVERKAEKDGKGGEIR